MIAVSYNINVKTLYLSIIVGVPVVMAIMVGIFLLNYESYTSRCQEGRLPNGTCAGPTMIDLGTNDGDKIKAECNTPYTPIPPQIITLPNGTTLTVNKVPVFLMKPNSTGRICIQYSQNDQGFKSMSQVTAGVFVGDNSQTKDVTIISDQSSIMLDSTNKTIVYTITTTDKAKGFYGFAPMFFNCIPLPLAVGYNASHVFDNDFPWLWEIHPCPFNGVDAQIIGLTNIDVAYITKVY